MLLAMDNQWNLNGESGSPSFLNMDFGLLDFDASTIDDTLPASLLEDGGLRPGASTDSGRKRQRDHQEAASLERMLQDLGRGPALQVPRGAEDQTAGGYERTDRKGRSDLKPDSLTAAKNKASRERQRRERLNESFIELAQVLDPGKPPKSDKTAIIADAIRTVTHMRAESHQLRQLNKFLEERVGQYEKLKSQLMLQQAYAMQAGGAGPSNLAGMQPGLLHQGILTSGLPMNGVPPQGSAMQLLPMQPMALPGQGQPMTLQAQLPPQPVQGQGLSMQRSSSQAESLSQPLPGPQLPAQAMSQAMPASASLQPHATSQQAQQSALSHSSPASAGPLQQPQQQALLSTMAGHGSGGSMQPTLVADLRASLQQLQHQPQQHSQEAGVKSEDGGPASSGGLILMAPPNMVAGFPVGPTLSWLPPSSLDISTDHLRRPPAA